MDKKIGEIRQELSEASWEEKKRLLEQYQNDTRAGVKKLCETYQKKYDWYLGELVRLQKMQFYEQKYQEYSLICGIDEAGRGPLAGPVVAGAVILPKNCTILYLNDSKKVSESKREELYEEIKEKAVSWAVGAASPQRIDEINILQATYEAMRNAVKGLSVKPEFLLNDAVNIPEVGIRQVGIIKGDGKSVSIAAASIMAKVTRDRMMREYDKLFPEYGFESNKGYGSKVHIEALRKHGPCAIHRTSFIHNFV